MSDTQLLERIKDRFKVAMDEREQKEKTNFEIWFEQNYKPAERTPGYWKDKCGKLLSSVAIKRLEEAFKAGAEFALEEPMCPCGERLICLSCDTPDEMVRHPC